MSESDERGGQVSNMLGLYIASEVAGAEQDYQNVRNRATNLLSTSAGLVALITGLLAIAVQRTNSSVPIVVRFTVAVALSSFVVSAAYALLINRPQTILGSDEAELEKWVKDDWDKASWEQDVAAIQSTYLTSLRVANVTNSTRLRWSIICQIVGIAFTSVSAVALLISAGHAA
jgi:hypothetical protein